MVEAKAFSQRRACRVVGLNRRSYDRSSKRQPDQVVEQAIEAVAQKHPGWGFWRPPRGKFITDCVGSLMTSITNESGEFTSRWG